MENKPLISDYKLILAKVGETLTPIISSVEHHYQVLKKIREYHDTPEGLLEFAENEMKSLPILIESIDNIKENLFSLRTICLEDIQNLAEFLKCDMEEVKNFQKIGKLNIEKTILLSDYKEYKDYIIEQMTLNEGFRFFFHQIAGMLGNASSISQLERVIAKQRQNKEVMIRSIEKIYRQIFTSEMQFKRFQRDWYTLLSLNNDDESIIKENHNTSLFQDYIELQKQRISNYYFAADYWEIDLTIDRLDVFDFIGDLYKIEEILDVFINNAADELSDKAFTERENNTEETIRKINFSIEKDKKENTFCIRIKDSGRGIENTKIIFEPYFSTKKSKGGSGIGLAAAIKLVKKLGGTVVVNTKLSKGSTFYLHLPIGISIKG